MLDFTYFKEIKNIFYHFFLEYIKFQALLKNSYIDPYVGQSMQKHDVDNVKS